MPLQCAACLKPIYSIDHVFQLYSKQCEASSSVYHYQTLANKKFACDRYLIGFYRYLRSQMIYRSSKQVSDSEINYTYYCSRCGLLFNDAKPYYGPILITYDSFEKIDARSFTPVRSRHLQGRELPSESGELLQSVSARRIDFDPPRPASEPSAAQMRLQAAVGECLSEQSRLMKGNHLLVPGAGFYSSTSSWSSVPLDSMPASRSASRGDEYAGSPTAMDSCGEPVAIADGTAVSPYNVVGDEGTDFSFISPQAIAYEVNINPKVYDNRLAKAGSSPWFIALQILSASFRRFVGDAEQDNLSLIRKLYKETTGFCNPTTTIQQWLAEAKSTFDSLEARRAPMSQQSFYLQRTPLLTVSGVESILAEIDKSFLPRPTYTRRTTFLLMCISLLAFFAYLMTLVASRESEDGHHPNPLPNVTTPHPPTHTTTTTITPLPIDPCFMPADCTKEVYQQVVVNLNWFLARGFTTLGELYERCSTNALFIFYRDVCFSTDPDFRDLIQSDDLITRLKEFFEGQLTGRLN